MASKSSSVPKTGTRAFATSARVYPTYLPYLHNSRSKGMKWVPPVVALVGVGYGVAAYREAQIERQIASAAAAEKEDAERQRRMAALMDAYGDRTSLDSLEHAMRVYEAQQGAE